VMWMDADDEVIGARQLHSVVAFMRERKLDVVEAQHVYAASGDQVTGQQTRERIVRKGRARWVGAVHEVLVSQGRSGRASESLCVRQRARVGKAARVAYRDLKILLHEHKHGRLDPRGLFYLARELRPVYEAQAIKFYEEYLLKDTWIEQRILGRLALGRIYEQRANPEGYEAAFREYAAAVAEEPTPEGYFALARIAYYRKDWPSCVRHSEAGLALGDPQGRCPINPLERKHTPHIYYNVALHGVGRVQDAIASCKAALTIAEHSQLRYNADFYEYQLGVGAPRAERFAVVVPAIPGYAHTAAFTEVAESIHYGLKALGLDTILTTMAPPHRRNILFGAHLIEHEIPQGTILYNLEQRWDERTLAHLHTHEVWDYSAHNVEKLQALGIPAQHVPVGFVPELVRIDKAPTDIDVLFYGSLNERRAQVLEALRARGLRVKHLFGTYGRERDAAIARSKIVLSMHFYEEAIFEEARVFYLLANGRFVVAERGHGDRFYKGAVALCSYDELVDECVRYVGDDHFRKRIAMVGRARVGVRPAASLLREALRLPSAEPERKVGT